MEKAMDVLSKFSEKETDYYQYLSRQEGIMEHKTIIGYSEKVYYEWQKEKERAEKERLIKILQNAGIKY